MNIYVFRLIGIILMWIGVTVSLKREDRLILNASPSFERSYQRGKYTKCKSIIQQLWVNAIGCLIAFVSTVICLVNHVEYQNQYVAYYFSQGFLAILLSAVIDFILIFRCRRRLRRWIVITNGKKEYVAKRNQRSDVKDETLMVLCRVFCLHYSHATVLHELGVDGKTIQVWEGHADQSTTANIKIKSSQTMTDQAEASLSDLASIDS